MCTTVRARARAFPYAQPRLQEELTAFEPALAGWWPGGQHGRGWSGVGQRIKREDTEDRIYRLLVAVEDGQFGYPKSNRLMVFHGF